MGKGGRGRNVTECPPEKEPPGQGSTVLKSVIPEESFCDIQMPDR